MVFVQVPFLFPEVGMAREPLDASPAGVVELLQQVAKDLVALGLSDDSGYLTARASQCRGVAELLEGRAKAREVLGLSASAEVG